MDEPVLYNLVACQLYAYCHGNDYLACGNTLVAALIFGFKAVEKLWMRLGKGSKLRRPEGSEISYSLRALAKKSSVPEYMVHDIRASMHKYLEMLIWRS